MNIKELIIKNEIGEVKENEDMSLHTTYKVGGICDLFVQTFFL